MNNDGICDLNITSKIGEACDIFRKIRIIWLSKTVKSTARIEIAQGTDTVLHAQ